MSRVGVTFDRSRLLASGASAGFAVILLFASLFPTADSGRLQAHEPVHTDTHAQICSGLITDSAQVLLRSDCAVLLDVKDELQGPVAPGGTAPLNWGDTGVAFDSWAGVALSGTGAERRLSVLDLPNSQLAGEIPEELGDLSALTLLNLSFNQLTGEIPTELGNLSSLMQLDLSFNQLTGEIPTELGDLSALTLLYLYNNRLTGSIPSKLGGLSSLTELRLDSNLLTGEIPTELGGLSALTLLYLTHNQLTGEIPTELGGLSSLSQLQLTRNQLTGEIPSSLGGLSSLTVLALRSNRLTGEIPSSLGGLSSLRWLTLNHNRLTGEIPSSLGGLSRLVALWLHNNQLTGEIPTELGGLSDLLQLELHSNRLTGEIPTELGNLSNLTKLHLFDNQLTGEIPDLNGLAWLEELGLGGNDLDLEWSMFESGGNLVLDASAPATRSLEILFLHDSVLEGSIPDWIGSTHTGLRELWLHGNDLTGEVPENFGDLRSLQDIRLHGNLLSGGFQHLTGLRRLGVVGLPADLFADQGRSTRLAQSGEILFGEDDDAIDLLWPALNSFFLKLSLPSGGDTSRYGVVVSVVLDDPVDPDAVHVPPHRRIARIVRVLADPALEITLEPRDARGEPVEGTPSVPAVVCLPVPSAEASDDTRVLKSADGEAWEYLETADPPAGYDPGAGSVAVCGTTDSFSVFVAAAVELALGSAAAGGIARILRIEPSIRSVTLRTGDEVVLSVEVWGRQNILDNALADRAPEDGRPEIVWTSSGAGRFSEGPVRTEWRDGSANDREVLFTAPDEPTSVTVTASLVESSHCLARREDETSDDHVARCSAEFEVKVIRRAEVAPDIGTAPVNPPGAIPETLTDDSGTAYAVFTPVEGGRFDGDYGYSVSADPGAVPDGEFIGVAMTAVGPASNVGMTWHHYTLGGQKYAVTVVDASGETVSDYGLASAVTVCVPLPAELRANIADIVLTATRGVSMTLLSTSVKITPVGVSVCGMLSELPATVAAGKTGSPPEAEADADEGTAEDETLPDTGGARSGPAWIVWMLLAGFVAVIVGTHGFRRVRHR